MPIADPAEWKLARSDWELTPEMTLTEVAARLNVSIPVVSVRAKRELWTKVATPIGAIATFTPEQLAQIALGRLVKIAMESKDENAAARASIAILDRTLGVPAQAKEPLAAPAEDVEAQEWPEWLTARRHLYQQAMENGGFQALEPPAQVALSSQEPLQAPDPPHALPERAQALPASQAELARAIKPSPERAPIDADANYRPLRLVEPPTPSFYDGPSTPASGPYRGS